MAAGYKSMYPVNIFINSMFKSFILRCGYLYLLLVIAVNPALSAGFQDTIPSGDTEVDSMLIFLRGTTFNRMLDQAIEFQKRADNLERLAIEWRKEAARMDDPIQKGKFQKQIALVEDSVEIYTQLANEHFQYLNASIPEKIKPEPDRPFLLKDTVLNGITVYKYKLNEEFLNLLAEIRTPAIGEEETDLSPATGKESTKSVEPSEAPEPSNKADVKAAASTLNGFKIYESSPYGPNKPFEREFSIPPGVFYRIQLAVYSKQLGTDHFWGLSPITAESIPERGLIRYFVGKFTHMEDASSALVKVRAMGYTDAFIIGYYDGNRSSFSKLKTLEK